MAAAATRSTGGRSKTVASNVRVPIDETAGIDTRSAGDVENRAAVAEIDGACDRPSQEETPRIHRGGELCGEVGIEHGLGPVLLVEDAATVRGTTRAQHLDKAADQGPSPERRVVGPEEERRSAHQMIARGR